MSSSLNPAERLEHLLQLFKQKEKHQQLSESQIEDLENALDTMEQIFSGNYKEKSRTWFSRVKDKLKSAFRNQDGEPFDYRATLIKNIAAVYDDPQEDEQFKLLKKKNSVEIELVGGFDLTSPNVIRISASREEDLKKDDRLVSVNNVSVGGKTKEEVMNMIRNAQDSVKLLIARKTAKEPGPGLKVKRLGRKAKVAMGLLTQMMERGYGGSTAPCEAGGPEQPTKIYVVGDSVSALSKTVKELEKALESRCDDGKVTMTVAYETVEKDRFVESVPRIRKENENGLLLGFIFVILRSERCSIYDEDDPAHSLYNEINVALQLLETKTKIFIIVRGWEKGISASSLHDEGIEDYWKIGSQTKLKAFENQLFTVASRELNKSQIEAIGKSFNQPRLGSATRKKQRPNADELLEKLAAEYDKPQEYEEEIAVPLKAKPSGDPDIVVEGGFAATASKVIRIKRTDDGDLVRGDRLLLVNGKSVGGMTEKEAKDTIEKAYRGRNFFSKLVVARHVSNPELRKAIVALQLLTQDDDRDESQC